MTKLGTAIAENIIYHYWKSELLTRLSDPFWFQAFGTVMRETIAQDSRGIARSGGGVGLSRRHIGAHQPAHRENR
jgi:hypothetical protein